MYPVQEERHHVEPEAMCRTVQIEGFVGDKEHSQLPGKQQIDQPPQCGDDQRGSGRHTVGFPHPVIVFRAEIVAVDGLDSGGYADKHRVGDLIDLHHHAVRRQGDIAAVNADCSIDAHQVIQNDLHQRGQTLGQQTGEAQLQDTPGQRPCGA